MNQLVNEVTIVTASNRDVGRASALKLACEGAPLVKSVLDAKPPQSVVEVIVAMDVAALACSGNATAPVFVDRIGI